MVDGKRLITVSVLEYCIALVFVHVGCIAYLGGRKFSHLFLLVEKGLVASVSVRKFPLSAIHNILYKELELAWDGLDHFEKFFVLQVVDTFFFLIQSFPPAYGRTTKQKRHPHCHSV